MFILCSIDFLCQNLIHMFVLTLKCCLKMFCFCFCSFFFLSIALTYMYIYIYCILLNIWTASVSLRPINVGTILSSFHAYSQNHIDVSDTRIKVAVPVLLPCSTCTLTENIPNNKNYVALYKHSHLEIIECLLYFV